MDEMNEMEDLPELTGRRCLWSTRDIPTDIEQWPNIGRSFKAGSHFLKVWSFSPNHIPLDVIPVVCIDSGHYSIHSRGEEERRNQLMKDHNKCPQWLAVSVFPNKFYVCVADEKHLQKKLLSNLKGKKGNLERSGESPPEDLLNDIIKLEGSQKELSNPEMQMKRRNQEKPMKKRHPKKKDDSDADDPKLSDVKVIEWLINDFINMFEDATSLLLKMAPFEGSHVDSRLDEEDTPKFPRKSKALGHGKSVCLYCAKCWKLKKEVPVCFLQINTEDSDDQTDGDLLAKKGKGFEGFEKDPIKSDKKEEEKESLFVDQKVAAGPSRNGIGPLMKQQRCKPDPWEGFHPPQREGFGPYIANRPDYYHGRGPADLHPDEIGQEKECWKNELMPREKSTHISASK